MVGWLRAQDREVLVIPIPPQFVHSDAVVGILEKGLMLVCQDALQPYALEFITDTLGIESFSVAYAVCVKPGGKIVSIGNKPVLSMSRNANVNAQLRRRGFSVEAVDFGMFAPGGGGVH